MDFVYGLPRTQKNHDAIWVEVDRLTKSAHFLAIRMDYSLERLAELYINGIVRLHGIPVSIVSDQDFGLACKKLLVPGKSNVPADDLSRKAESMGSFAFILVVERPFSMDIQALANRLSSLFERIKDHLYDDPRLFVLQDILQRVVLRRFPCFESTMKISHIHVLDFSSVQLDENLAYGEESVAILDRQVRKLRSKDIASVKVTDGVTGKSSNKA
ncbi:uncharacterized protein LOC142166781 [Nicotiana tabacum]|uniref:Uncharacterized protein LOC142166781 n=1 Tax=Nicotiana tabacum TaxID=4097 RepID=A0AC58SAY0_TOBAC